MWTEKLSAQYKKSDLKVINRVPVYQGFFKMSEYRIKHRLFNGGWSQEFRREIFERDDAVAVLPYDPIRKEVVLIEQFRAGAIEHPESPWLFECIAGMIDKQETPEQVAIREAKEEANLDVQKLLPMLSYLSSPGGATERLHLYLGIVDSENAGGVYGLDEEGEDIKVHTVSVEQAFAMLDEGKLDNAATLIAVQWLKLQLPTLEFDV